MNTCRICNVEKPVDQFEPLPSGNRRKVCRKCIQAQKQAKPDWQKRRRNVLLRHKYKIEPEQYQQMLEAQGGACAVCREVVEYDLYVDHCHDSLEVRGLLCRPCNTGLGNFRDNVTYLKQAIDYLERR